MPPPPERQDVSFDSGGVRCHAWLYEPAARPGATAPPVVVMAHGLGGIKRLRLAAFAEHFQVAGYACLVFDYRHFGDSGGEPRELLSIRRQREDWRAAVAHARTLPQVDTSRIVLWGTSFAGGHAIVTAAGDPQVTATIVQCPFTDGFASSRQLALSPAARLGLAGVADLVALACRRPPVRVGVVARNGEVGLMDAPDVIEGVQALLDASGLTESEYPNDVPARIALTIPFDRPGRKAAAVGCPILFCVCDHDSVAPAEATLRHAAKAPRGEVVRYDAGHFDIYVGERFERLVADQLAFLARHVPVGR